MRDQLLSVMRAVREREGNEKGQRQRDRLKRRRAADLARSIDRVRSEEGGMHCFVSLSLYVNVFVVFSRSEAGASRGGVKGMIWSRDKR